MTREEIKELRNSLNLNQAQFAQLLGVHAVTVSNWERGAYPPNPHQLGLLTHFREGAKDNEVKDNLLKILVGVGVGVAIALLLKHLLSKK